MRELFRLPYRNTEGFGRWVFQVMQLDLAIPDYTSLCKRAAKLGIAILLTKKKGKIDGSGRPLHSGSTLPHRRNNPFALLTDIFT